MNMRKIVIGAGVALVLAGGGLFLAKTQMESKVRDGITTFLAGLPQPMTGSVEKIDVSFFSKSVALSNLRLIYAPEDGNTLEYVMARVEANGVNLDAMDEGAGVVKIADSVRFVDAFSKAPNFHSHVETQTLENVSGDLGKILKKTTINTPAMIAMMKMLDNAQPVLNQEQIEHMSAFANVYEAYETLSTGKSVSKNYTYGIEVEGRKFDYSIDSIEAADMSFRGFSSFSINNFSMFEDGAKLATIQSITCGKTVIPSFVEIFRADAETLRHGNPLVLLKGKEFSLNGLRLRDFVIPHPEDKDKNFLKIAELQLDYDASGTAHNLLFAYNDAAVEKTLIPEQKESPLGMALLPDTLYLSSRIDLSVTPKEEQAFDLNCKQVSFHEKTLGGYALSGAVDDISPIHMYMGAPSKAAIKNLSLKLEDTGISQVLFSFMADEDNRKAPKQNDEENAAEQEQATAANMRAHIAANLHAQRETLPNDTLKGLVDTLHAFILSSGGTFEAAIAPEKPLPVDALQQITFTAPEQLGLTHSFTPAQ